MPRKTKNKEHTGAATSPNAEAVEKAAEQPTPGARRQRTKRRVQASTRPSRGKTKRMRKVASRSRRGRVRYSDAERQRILATAKREGLTSAQVHDRFGVSTLTYYTWRKKAKSKAPSSAGGLRRRSRGSLAGGKLVDAIHEEIQARISDLLPEIVRSEIANALGVAASRRGR